MSSRRLILRAGVLAASALACLGGASASADTTTITAAGTWTAHPGQATVDQTAVQQPINADGSSNFKGNGKAVIPVRLKLSRGIGPFVFESIGTDTSTASDYSSLSFAPAAPTTFSDVARLAASYGFTAGTCHGGSLRWSVRVSATQSVFIYYGTWPNFNSCAGTEWSDVNLIGMADLRYDTSQVGGTFYDSYADAQALVGTMPIVRASLVLDSGWGGDQQVTLNSATVNDATFTPGASVSPAPTCDLPPATVLVEKIGGSPTGAVNEPVTIQPQDSDGSFRVVDCTYMYSLATSSLSGVGTYRVSAVIGGDTAAGGAVFDIR